MHVFSLQSSDDSSTLVYVTSFPYEESRMTTVDFITALFSKVDEQLHAIPKHPEAPLWPSEVVTLGLLTNGVSILETDSARWTHCNGHALAPSW